MAYPGVGFERLVAKGDTTSRTPSREPKQQPKTMNAIHTVQNPLDILIRARHMQEDALLTVLGRALSALPKMAVRALRQAELRRQLDALDDHLLADIGLHRSDIPAVAARSYLAQDAKHPAPQAAELHILQPTAPVADARLAA